VKKKKKLKKEGYKCIDNVRGNFNRGGKKKFKKKKIDKGRE
jgi:hypothetical protein